MASRFDRRDKSFRSAKLLEASSPAQQKLSRCLLFLLLLLQKEQTHLHNPKGLSVWCVLPPGYVGQVLENNRGGNSGTVVGTSKIAIRCAKDILHEVGYKMARRFTGFDQQALVLDDQGSYALLPDGAYWAPCSGTRPKS